MRRVGREMSIDTNRGKKSRERRVKKENQILERPSETKGKTEKMPRRKRNKGRLTPREKKENGEGRIKSSCRDKKRDLGGEELGG